MIHCFAVPTIVDKLDFTQILINPLPSETMSELIVINEARKKFKAVLNELFLNQTAFGESISQYRDTVDNYLSQNVDLIRILALHKTQPIAIVWKTFLTQGAEFFTTKGTNEETLAIELVMARYCFAFAYYHEACPLINSIREKFILTLKSTSINEEYEKNIAQILDLFYTGWEKIKKLHNVIKDVSKSIVLSDSYILEAKGNTLDAIKNILEVNANYFYIESLRLQKEYKRIALVANGNIRRLKQAKSILELDGKDVRTDLLEFLDIAIKFYRIYGMWGLMTYYEKMIDRDEYEKKEYVKITLHMLCMADQTLGLCSELKKSKLDKNGHIYRSQQYAAYFEPFCVRITQIYTSVHQHAARVDGERCLAEIGEEDYLEDRFSKK